MSWVASQQGGADCSSVPPDLDQITDEEFLKHLWQQAEDFSDRRRIRARMYKLREKRLREMVQNDEENLGALTMTEEGDSSFPSTMTESDIHPTIESETTQRKSSVEGRSMRSESSTSEHFTRMRGVDSRRDGRRGPSDEEIIDERIRDVSKGRGARYQQALKEYEGDDDSMVSISKSSYSIQSNAFTADSYQSMKHKEVRDSVSPVRSAYDRKIIGEDSENFMTSDEEVTLQTDGDSVSSRKFSKEKRSTTRLSSSKAVTERKVSKELDFSSTKRTDKSSPSSPTRRIPGETFTSRIATRKQGSLPGESLPGPTRQSPDKKTPTQPGSRFPTSRKIKMEQISNDMDRSLKNEYQKLDRYINENIDDDDEIIDEEEEEVEDETGNTVKMIIQTRRKKDGTEMVSRRVARSMKIVEHESDIDEILVGNPDHEVIDRRVEEKEEADGSKIKIITETRRRPDGIEYTTKNVLKTSKIFDYDHPEDISYNEDDELIGSEESTETDENGITIRTVIETRRKNDGVEYTTKKVYKTSKVDSTITPSNDDEILDTDETEETQSDGTIIKIVIERRRTRDGQEYTHRQTYRSRKMTLSGIDVLKGMPSMGNDDEILDRSEKEELDENNTKVRIVTETRRRKDGSTYSFDYVLRSFKGTESDIKKMAIQSSNASNINVSENDELIKEEVKENKQKDGTTVRTVIERRRAIDGTEYLRHRIMKIPKLPEPELVVGSFDDEVLEENVKENVLEDGTRCKAITERRRSSVTGIQYTLRRMSKVYQHPGIVQDIDEILDENVTEEEAGDGILVKTVIRRYQRPDGTVYTSHDIQKTYQNPVSVSVEGDENDELIDRSYDERETDDGFLIKTIVETRCRTDGTHYTVERMEKVSKLSDDVQVSFRGNSLASGSPGDTVVSYEEHEEPFDDGTIMKTSIEVRRRRDGTEYTNKTMIKSTQVLVPESETSYVIIKADSKDKGTDSALFPSLDDEIVYTRKRNELDDKGNPITVIIETRKSKTTGEKYNLTKKVHTTDVIATEHGEKVLSRRTRPKGTLNGVSPIGSPSTIKNKFTSPSKKESPKPSSLVSRTTKRPTQEELTTPRTTTSPKSSAPVRKTPRTSDKRGVDRPQSGEDSDASVTRTSKQPIKRSPVTEPRPQLRKPASLDLKEKDKARPKDIPSLRERQSPVSSVRIPQDSKARPLGTRSHELKKLERSLDSSPERRSGSDPLGKESPRSVNRSKPEITTKREPDSKTNRSVERVPSSPRSGRSPLRSGPSTPRETTPSRQSYKRSPDHESPPALKPKSTVTTTRRKPADDKPKPNGDIKRYPIKPNKDTSKKIEPEKISKFEKPTLKDSPMKTQPTTRTLDTKNSPVSDPDAKRPTRASEKENDRVTPVKDLSFVAKEPIVTLPQTPLTEDMKAYPRSYSPFIEDVSGEPDSPFESVHRPSLVREPSDYQGPDSLIDGEPEPTSNDTIPSKKTREKNHSDIKLSEISTFSSSEDDDSRRLPKQKKDGPSETYTPRNERRPLREVPKDTEEPFSREQFDTPDDADRKVNGYKPVPEDEGPYTARTSPMIEKTPRNAPKNILDQIIPDGEKITNKYAPKLISEPKKPESETRSSSITSKLSLFEKTSKTDDKTISKRSTPTLNEKRVPVKEPKVVKKYIHPLGSDSESDREDKGDDKMTAEEIKLSSTRLVMNAMGTEPKPRDKYPRNPKDDIPKREDIISSIRERSKSPRAKDSSPHPRSKEGSPRAKDSSPHPRSKEGSPRAKDSSPHPRSKEGSPAPFVKEDSPGRFLTGKPIDQGPNTSKIKRLERSNSNKKMIYEDLEINEANLPVYLKDIEYITDVTVLETLLQKAETYEERRIIRGHIRTLKKTDTSLTKSASPAPYKRFVDHTTPSKPSPTASPVLTRKTTKTTTKSSDTSYKVETSKKVGQKMPLRPFEVDEEKPRRRPSSGESEPSRKSSMDEAEPKRGAPSEDESIAFPRKPSAEEPVSIGDRKVSHDGAPRYRKPSPVDTSYRKPSPERSDYRRPSSDTPKLGKISPRDEPVSTRDRKSSPESTPRYRRPSPGDTGYRKPSPERSDYRRPSSDTPKLSKISPRDESVSTRDRKSSPESTPRYRKPSPGETGYRKPSPESIIKERRPSPGESDHKKSPDETKRYRKSSPENLKYRRTSPTDVRYRTASPDGIPEERKKGPDAGYRGNSPDSSTKYSKPSDEGRRPMTHTTRDSSPEESKKKPISGTSLKKTPSGEVPRTLRKTPTSQEPASRTPKDTVKSEIRKDTKDEPKRYSQTTPSDKVTPVRTPSDKSTLPKEPDSKDKTGSTRTTRSTPSTKDTPSNSQLFMEPLRHQRTVSRTPQKQTNVDKIVSPYGVGPTDENGVPLFGLKALKRRPQQPQDDSEEAKPEEEPKDFVPSDAQGRPLFGIRAVRKTTVEVTKPTSTRVTKETTTVRDSQKTSVNKTETSRISSPDRPQSNPEEAPSTNPIQPVMAEDSYSSDASSDDSGNTPYTRADRKQRRIRKKELQPFPGTSRASTEDEIDACAQAPRRPNKYINKREPNSDLSSELEGIHRNQGQTSPSLVKSIDDSLRRSSTTSEDEVEDKSVSLRDIIKLHESKVTTETHEIESPRFKPKKKLRDSFEPTNDDSTETRPVRTWDLETDLTTRSDAVENIIAKHETLTQQESTTKSERKLTGILKKTSISSVHSSKITSSDSERDDAPDRTDIERTTSRPRPRSPLESDETVSEDTPKSERKTSYTEITLSKSYPSDSDESKPLRTIKGKSPAEERLTTTRRTSSTDKNERCQQKVTSETETTSYKTSSDENKRRTMKRAPNEKPQQPTDCKRAKSPPTKRDLFSVDDRKNKTVLPREPSKYDKLPERKPKDQKSTVDQTHSTMRTTYDTETRTSEVKRTSVSRTEELHYEIRDTSSTLVGTLKSTRDTSDADSIDKDSIDGEENMSSCSDIEEETRPTNRKSTRKSPERDRSPQMKRKNLQPKTDSTFPSKSKRPQDRDRFPAKKTSSPLSEKPTRDLKDGFKRPKPRDDSEKRSPGPEKSSRSLRDEPKIHGDDSSPKSKRKYPIVSSKTVLDKPIKKESLQKEPMKQTLSQGDTAKSKKDPTKDKAVPFSTPDTKEPLRRTKKEPEEQQPSDRKLERKAPGRVTGKEEPKASKPEKEPSKQRSLDKEPSKSKPVKEGRISGQKVQDLRSSKETQKYDGEYSPEREKAKGRNAEKDTPSRRRPGEEMPTRRASDQEIEETDEDILYAPRSSSKNIETHDIRTTRVDVIKTHREYQDITRKEVDDDSSPENTSRVKRTTEERKPTQYVDKSIKNKPNNEIDRFKSKPFEPIKSTCVKESDTKKPNKKKSDGEMNLRPEDPNKEEPGIKKSGTRKPIDEIGRRIIGNEPDPKFKEEPASENPDMERPRMTRPEDAKKQEKMETRMTKLGIEEPVGKPGTERSNIVRPTEDHKYQPTREVPERSRPSHEEPHRRRTSIDERERDRSSQELSDRCKPSREELGRSKPSREKPERHRRSGEEEESGRTSSEETDRQKPFRDKPDILRSHVEEPYRRKTSREELGRSKPISEEPDRRKPSKDDLGRTKPFKEEPERERPCREEPEREKPAINDSRRDKPSSEEPDRRKPTREEPERRRPSREESQRSKPFREEAKKSQHSQEESDKHKPFIAEPFRRRPSREETVRIQPVQVGEERRDEFEAQQTTIYQDSEFTSFEKTDLNIRKDYFEYADETHTKIIQRSQEHEKEEHRKQNLIPEFDHDRPKREEPNKIQQKVQDTRRSTVEDTREYQRTRRDRNVEVIKYETTSVDINTSYVEYDEGTRETLTYDSSKAEPEDEDTDEGISDEDDSGRRPKRKPVPKVTGQKKSDQKGLDKRRPGREEPVKRGAVKDIPGRKIGQKEPDKQKVGVREPIGRKPGFKESDDSKPVKIEPSQQRPEIQEPGKSKPDRKATGRRVPSVERPEEVRPEREELSKSRPGLEEPEKPRNRLIESKMKRDEIKEPGDVKPGQKEPWRRKPSTGELEQLRPERDEPVKRRPGLEEPEERKQRLEEPSWRRPEFEEPEERKPRLGETGREVSTPGKPGEIRPEQDEPGMRRPGLQDPKERKQALEEPGWRKPGFEAPEERKTRKGEPGRKVSSPRKPEEIRPERYEPGMRRPGLEKPEEREPGGEEPGSRRPGLQEAEKWKPRKGEPCRKSSSLGEPGEIRPERDETGKRRPGLEEPEEREPERVEPSWRRPGLEEPEKRKPKKGEPGIKVSSLGKPGEVRPERDEQGKRRPGLEEPEERKSGREEPNSRKLGLDEPEERKPRQGEPRRKISTPGKLADIRPERDEPGERTPGLEEPEELKQRPEETGWRKPGFEEPEERKHRQGEPGRKVSSPGKPVEMRPERDEPGMRRPGLEEPEERKSGREETGWRKPGFEEPEERKHRQGEPGRKVSSPGKPVEMRPERDEPGMRRPGLEEPEELKQRPEETGWIKPGFEEPEERKPRQGEPGRKASSPGKPGEKRPEEQDKPGMRRLGLEEPEELKQRREEPGWRRPGLEEPEERKPRQGEPGRKVSTPGKPGEIRPERDEPGKRRPGLEEPEERKSGREETGLRKPGFEEPEERKPRQEEPGRRVSSPGKPGEMRPERDEPESRRPGLEEPEELKQRREEPGWKRPGLEEPEERKHRQEEPGRNVSTPGKPGEIRPERDEPGKRRPGLEEPEERKSGREETGWRKPGFEEPEERKPRKGEPGRRVSSPGKPGEMRPERNEPDMRRPGLEEPEELKQRREEPGWRRPGLEESEERKPRQGEPGRKISTPGKPGEIRPERDEPGKRRPSLEEPEERKSGREETGWRKPGFEEPEERKPRKGEPGRKVSSPGKPGEMRPERDEPDMRRPGLQEPEELKQRREEPGWRRPGLEEPEERKPRQGEPGRKISTPGKPGERRPELDESGKRRPGLEEPEERESGREKTGWRKPGFEEPEERKPRQGEPVRKVSSPGKPGEMRPERDEPGMRRPGLEEPEELKQRREEPGWRRPGLEKPEERKPRQGEPGRNVSTPGKPGEIRPERDEPGKRRPGLEEPEERKSGREETGWRKPGFEEPEERKPRKGEPGRRVSSPGRPGEMRPERNEPDMRRPGLEEPEELKQRREESGWRRPGLEESEEMKPRQGEPGRKISTPGKPGEIRPERDEPGKRRTSLEEPEERKSGREETGWRKPGFEEPEERKPRKREPGRKVSSPGKPGEMRPERDEPGMRRPELEEPEELKQRREEPGWRRPGLEEPEERKPRQGEPSIKISTAGKPGERRPERDEPVKRRPGLEEPEERESGREETGWRKPGFEEPEERKPRQGEPGRKISPPGKPGEMRPEKDEPVRRKPGLEKPEERKQGLEEPGSRRPGFEETEERKPRQGEPGRKVSSPGKPGEIRPDQDELGKRRLGLEEPEEREPGRDEPGSRRSGFEKPDERKPRQGEPLRKISSPRKPGKIRSEHDEPGNRRPRLEEPEELKQRREEPGWRRPGLEEPEEMKPRQGEPGIKVSTPGKPREIRPERDEPGMRRPGLEEPEELEQRREEPGWRRAGLEEPEERKPRQGEPGRKIYHPGIPGEMRPELDEPVRRKLGLDKPEERKQGLEEPGSRRPGFEEPEEKKPRKGEPSRKVSSPVKPGEIRQERDEPGMRRLGLEKPEEHEPGREEPVSRRLGFAEPEERKPRQGEPCRKVSSIGKPAEIRPERDEPGKRKPRSEDPEGHKPREEEPGWKRPGLEEPEERKHKQGEPVRKLSTPGKLGEIRSERDEPEKRRPGVEEPEERKAGRGEPGFKRSAFKEPIEREPREGDPQRRVSSPGKPQEKSRDLDEFSTRIPGLEEPEDCKPAREEPLWRRPQFEEPEETKPGRVERDRKIPSAGSLKPDDRRSVRDELLIKRPAYEDSDKRKSLRDEPSIKPGFKEPLESISRREEAALSPDLNEPEEISSGRVKPSKSKPGVNECKPGRHVPDQTSPGTKEPTERKPENVESGNLKSNLDRSPKTKADTRQTIARIPEVKDSGERKALKVQPFRKSGIERPDNNKKPGKSLPNREEPIRQKLGAVDTTPSRTVKDKPRKQIPAQETPGKGRSTTSIPDNNEPRKHRPGIVKSIKPQVEKDEPSKRRSSPTKTKKQEESDEFYSETDEQNVRKPRTDEPVRLRPSSQDISEDDMPEHKVITRDIEISRFEKTNVHVETSLESKTTEIRNLERPEELDEPGDICSESEIPGIKKSKVTQPRNRRPNTNQPERRRPETEQQELLEPLKGKPKGYLKTYREEPEKISRTEPDPRQKPKELYGTKIQGEDSPKRRRPQDIQHGGRKPNMDKPFTVDGRVIDKRDREKYKEGSPRTVSDKTPGETPKRKSTPICQPVSPVKDKIVDSPKGKKHGTPGTNERTPKRSMPSRFSKSPEVGDLPKRLKKLSEQHKTSVENISDTLGRKTSGTRTYSLQSLSGASTTSSVPGYMRPRGESRSSRRHITPERDPLDLEDYLLNSYQYTRCTKRVVKPPVKYDYAYVINKNDSPAGGGGGSYSIYFGPRGSTPSPKSSVKETSKYHDTFKTVQNLDATRKLSRDDRIESYVNKPSVDDLSHRPIEEIKIGDVNNDSIKDSTYLDIRQKYENTVKSINTKSSTSRDDAFITLREPTDKDSADLPSRVLDDRDKYSEISQWNEDTVNKLTDESIMTKSSGIRSSERKEDVYASTKDSSLRTDITQDSSAQRYRELASKDYKNYGIEKSYIFDTPNNNNQHFSVDIENPGKIMESLVIEDKIAKDTSHIDKKDIYSSLSMSEKDDQFIGTSETQKIMSSIPDTYYIKEDHRDVVQKSAHSIMDRKSNEKKYNFQAGREVTNVNEYDDAAPKGEFMLSHKESERDYNPSIPVSNRYIPNYDYNKVYLDKIEKSAGHRSMHASTYQSTSEVHDSRSQNASRFYDVYKDNRNTDSPHTHRQDDSNYVTFDGREATPERKINPSESYKKAETPQRGQAAPFSKLQRDSGHQGMHASSYKSTSEIYDSRSQTDSRFYDASGKYINTDSPPTGRQDDSNYVTFDGRQATPERKINPSESYKKAESPQNGQSAPSSELQRDREIQPMLEKTSSAAVKLDSSTTFRSTRSSPSKTVYGEMAPSFDVTKKDGRSFLDDRSKVTGISDVLTRMEASGAVDHEARVTSDDQARSLLNKFIGAQVLMTGVESMMANTSNTQTSNHTSMACDGDGKMTVTRNMSGEQVRKTMRDGDATEDHQKFSTGPQTITYSTSSSSPKVESADIVRGVNINEVTDDFALNQLLDSCEEYDERRRVRMRLKSLMAEKKTLQKQLSGHERSELYSSSRRTAGVPGSKGSDLRSSEGTSSYSVSRGSSKVTSQKSSYSSSYSTQSNSTKSYQSTRDSKVMSPFDKFKHLDSSNTRQNQNATGPAASGPLFQLSNNLIRSASGVKDMILTWCQCRTRDYQGVKIENFSTSWNDGLAFCALIHHFYPDAFDFNSLNSKNRRHNFSLAFRTADEKAGVMPLLDVDDMVMMKKPDWKCVFTYVQSLYKRLKDE